MLNGLASAIRSVFANRQPAPSQRVRRFDGAGRGARWFENTTFHDINAETLAGAVPLRRRAAYYARNNPWITNAVSGIVANAIGVGIRPASQHPDKVMRKALENRWARWCATADADGMTDLYGLQANATRQMIEGGECFARFEPSDDPRNGLFKVRLLDSDMVDMALTRELGNNARLVGGVEFDGQGRRVAYHVSPKRPGELFTIASSPVRIPATDMAHLFQALAPGQVRGVSWLAPVLLRIRELDYYEDAQLAKQRTSAMLAGFIKKTLGGPDDPPPGVSPSNAAAPNTKGEIEQEWAPGTMIRLEDGEDITFSDPPEVGDAVPFLRLQLKSIAAGLGVPDYILTGDMSDANYSSMRTALVEFRRRLEMLQFSVIIHQFCRPIWERFVIASVLSGAIEAPDFEKRMDDYLSAEWYPPAQDWIDPTKDVQAEELAVANGFKSRRQVVTERGYDIEQLDAEIAADRAREKSLGISVGPKPSTPIQAQQENANAGNG
jgi:lambda family phage portal protein